MITSVRVSGFKTLSDFYLELRPGLNVLVGPNGTGKTNIVSFFEFLARLIDSDASEATSHLGGAGSVFRRVKDSYEPTMSADITGCFRLDEYGPWRYFSSRKGRKERALYGVYEYSFTLLLSDELESVVFTRQSFRFRHASRFHGSGTKRDSMEKWGLELETKLDAQMVMQASVKQFDPNLIEFPFYPSTASDPRERKAQTESFLSKIIPANASVASAIARYNPGLMPLSEDMAGGQTYNIVPSRVKLPEDSAKPPGIAQDGSGLSATLYALKRRKLADEDRPWFTLFPNRKSALRSTAIDTLKSYFHLANQSLADFEVTNDPFDNRLRVSFVVRNGDYDATVPLSFMSDGTLKWLSLVTAALTAPSVFSIEEPENYLHPQMQGQFVEIMREILFKEKKDACTMMTTHSETLLNHCKPDELIVVSLCDGRTRAYRCENQRELSAEIEKTGFGLGYYYIAGAVFNE